MDIYLLKQGEKLGPYAEAQVHELLSSGVISPKDMGWREGLTEWIPVGLLLVGFPSPSDYQSYTIPFIVKRTTFRVLVGLSCVLLILNFIAIGTQSLPEPLTSYLHSPERKLSGFISMLMMLSLVGLLTSYVGLFRLKKWGRTLFTTMIIVLLILSFGEKPIVESAAVDQLGSIYDMLSGAILTISFVTPLFNKTSKSDS